ncbi:MAG: ABC transporter permease [Bryobacteraceae bacterium]
MRHRLVNALQTFVADIRYSSRLLRQDRFFTTVAVLSLALGIGANTAIFSLIDSVLLKWLPVRNPQELVVLARNPAKPQTGFNNPDYEYVRDHNQVFAGVVASSGGGMPLGMTIPNEGRGEAQLVAGTLVSGNYFDVLGVGAALGRLLNTDDNKTPGAAPYAALSYAFWQRRLGGNTGVLGKKIVLNGSPFWIVGVAQRGFTGTAAGSSPDLFLPIMMLQQVDANARQWNTRHYWWLNVIGRLKPGVNVAQATGATNVLFDRIEQNDPERKPAPSYDKDRKARSRATLLPGAQGYSGFRNRLSKPLLVLMITVGLVLLIACANVANLLLARAAAREKEIAIRLAVGAGRTRLISQLLTESVMLSVLGGIAGLAFAYGGVKVLVGLMPVNIFPIELNLSPDLRLLGFSFGVSVLTGLLFGVAPALKATRPDLVPSLKNDSATPIAGRIDARRILVVVQVGLSLLLLIGAGLFVRSLDNLRELDPGFVRDKVLLVGVSPAQSGYKGQRLRNFYEHLEERTQRLPGVRSASLAVITPLAGRRWNSDIAIQGYQWKPNEEPFIDMNSVSPRYFDTMGIPILLGRDFRIEDSPSFTSDPVERKPGVKPGPRPEDINGPPRVAIINEVMATRFFPHESALGKRFSIDEKFKTESSYEIVGVVRASKYFGLREPPGSMIYVPTWREGPTEMTLCLRTTGDPPALIEAVRRVVQNLDNSIPVLRSRSMVEEFNENIAQERIIAILCGFFGTLALLLASIGLYGVMAHAVTRRTREIGIRMALGAQRNGVLWMMLRDAVILVVVGGLIGVPVALGVTRFVASFLYGLTAHDPVVMAGACGVLLVVTLIASYLPARRATKVDPMIALRYE